MSKLTSYKKKKSAKKGFTLVELLVSIAIFSIMLVLMSNIVISMSRFSLENEWRTDFLTELDNVSNVVKNDLRSATEVVKCPSSNTIRRRDTNNNYFKLEVINSELVWSETDLNCSARATPVRLSTNNSLRFADIGSEAAIEVAQAEDSRAAGSVTNNLFYIRLQACDPVTGRSKPIFDCQRNPYRYMFAISSRKAIN